MSLSYIINPKGTVYYYSSAKFRELQLDRLIYGSPTDAFPTVANFFLANHHDSIRYSETVDNIDTYYGYYDSYSDPTTRFLRTNFNVTHVYRATRDVKLFDLMNVDNIHYLLFTDQQSPFHYSRTDHVLGPEAGENIRFSIKSSPIALAYMKGHNIDIFGDAKRTGFALLSLATGYCYLTDTVVTLKRHSDTAFDYILAELMNKYLKSRCDGWYQTPGKFHEEWMFFQPDACLETVRDHAKSWFSALEHSGWSSLTLHRKEVIRLGLIQRWRKEEEANLQRELILVREQLAALKPCGHEGHEGHEGECEIHEERESYLWSLEDIPKRLQQLRTQVPTTYTLAQMLKLTENCRGAEVQNYVNRKILAAQSSSVCFSTCQDKMDKLVQEMGLYANPDNVHHRGARVSDHSVWVTRAMHRWLGYRDHPWTYDINNGLRNLALIASFLHDVGKIGDADTVGLRLNGVKPEHPVRGYEYLLSQSTFKKADGTHSQLLSDVTNGCLLTDSSVATVATVAALHHHLGELLMSRNTYLISTVGNAPGWKPPSTLVRTQTKYIEHSLLYSGTLLSRLLDTIREFKYIVFYLDFLLHYSGAGGDTSNKTDRDQVLRILLAVSAADVYGAYPVEDSTDLDTIYEAGISSLLDPQILRYKTESHPMSAGYSELFRPYYRYLYYTQGLKERANLLAYVDTVVDVDLFTEGWTSFRKLLDHIDGKGRLPSVFRTLDVSSTESFIRDLFRLLKSGEASGGPQVTQLPATIIQELTSTRVTTRSKDLISKFRYHLHPGMSATI